jgi:hypothetical protein
MRVLAGRFAPAARRLDTVGASVPEMGACIGRVWWRRCVVVLLVGFA